jgi:hypothetical protein
MVGLLALMVNRKNLTDTQRIRLEDYLLKHLANGKLPREILKAATVKFYVTWQTCSRLWTAWSGARTLALKNGEWDVTSGNKGSGCGLLSIIMLT